MLVDDGLSAGLAAPHLPRGIAVGYSVPGHGGLWHEVTRLQGGRIGVSVGRTDDLVPAEHAATDVGEALRSQAGPTDALASLQAPTAAAVCAVIEPSNSMLRYSAIGDIAPVIAGPGVGHRTLDCGPGSVGTAAIAPGETLLLCTGDVDKAGVLLDECMTDHPRQAVEHILGALTAAVDPEPLAVLLYRHPPAPMDITVDAKPANLAVLRARLRDWLTLAGVEPEDSADALLAVGEAASNSAEHSVVGAPGEVEIRMRASIDGDTLRFTVSDTGRWKQTKDLYGYRGHGIKLINALVDSTDLTTGEHGTTVEMLKEMTP